VARTGRPRLEPNLKARRGTLRPHRERRHRSDPKAAPAVAVQRRDYVAKAFRYAEDAVQGRSVVCGWGRKAAQRFLTMRTQSQGASCGYTFPVEHANPKTLRSQS